MDIFCLCTQAVSAKGRLYYLSMRSNFPRRHLVSLYITISSIMFVGYLFLGMLHCKLYLIRFKNVLFWPIS